MHPLKFLWVYTPALDTFHTLIEGQLLKTSILQWQGRHEGKERLLKESSQSGRPVNNARNINSSRKKTGLVCSAASNICTGCFKFCLCIPPQILLLSNSLILLNFWGGRFLIWFPLQNWELQLHDVKVEDSGQYTCQVDLQFTKHLSDRLTVYNLQYICQIDWQFTTYNTPVR